MLITIKATNTTTPLIKKLGCSSHAGRKPWRKNVWYDACLNRFCHLSSDDAASSCGKAVAIGMLIGRVAPTRARQLGHNKVNRFCFGHSSQQHISKTICRKERWGATARRLIGTNWEEATNQTD